MISFALALDLAAEDRLAGEAVAHGHDIAVRAGTPGELIGRLGSTRIDIVIVGASERFLTRDLIAAADTAGVRLLALARHAHDADRARSLAVQSADEGIGFEELVALCEGPIPAAAASDPGRVITVWGTHGAPGRTTGAIAIASELAAAGASAVLVDADTHAAAVAPSLGLLDESPGFAAAARLARQGVLTVAELERVSAGHEVGGSEFRVLTGIARSDRWPELQADRVASVLSECRRWVDHTVVDVAASLESDDLVSSDLHAPRRNAATLAALQSADVVVAMVGADAIGMTRFLRVLPELTDIVGPDRVKVIVNRVRTGAAGLVPDVGVAETLERFASVTPFGMWPFDPGAADAALLTGRPLREAAPRSLLRRRVTETVQQLLPEQERTTRRARRHAERQPRRGLRRLARLH